MAIKKKANNDSTFTALEVELQIRNLMLTSTRVQDAEIDVDSRKATKLLVFARALTTPLIEMVEAGALTIQELVYALIASAYFVQCRYVMGLEKPPAKIRLVAKEEECQEIEQQLTQNTDAVPPTESKPIPESSSTH